MNINILEQILESKNISQRELADMINVTPNTITNLKKGDFKISTLEKIAKALNVNISIFFDETQNNDMIKLKVKQGENNIINLNGTISDLESVRNENIMLRERLREMEKDKVELIKDKAQLIKNIEFLQKLLEKHSG